MVIRVCSNGVATSVWTSRFTAQCQFRTLPRLIPLPGRSTGQFVVARLVFTNRLHTPQIKSATPTLGLCLSVHVALEDRSPQLLCEVELLYEIVAHTFMKDCAKWDHPAVQTGWCVSVGTVHQTITHANQVSTKVNLSRPVCV